jgi:hypothetical protein
VKTDFEGSSSTVSPATPPPPWSSSFKLRPCCSSWTAGRASSRPHGRAAKYASLRPQSQGCQVVKREAVDTARPKRACRGGIETPSGAAFSGVEGRRGHGPISGERVPSRPPGGGVSSLISALMASRSRRFRSSCISSAGARARFSISRSSLARATVGGSSRKKTLEELVRGAEVPASFVRS